MRVYLVGFMGCGKSAIGRHLARNMELEFIDLDERIEEAAGITIREIFELHGEEAFRDLEHRCLRETGETDNLVISTGGGTITFARNREVLRELGKSVWIHPSFETVLNRMSERGKEKRPLFQSPEQAEALFQSRIPAYQTADFEIKVSPNETAAQVAARIAAQLLGARPRRSNNGTPRQAAGNHRS